MLQHFITLRSPDTTGKCNASVCNLHSCTCRVKIVAAEKITAIMIPSKYPDPSLYCFQSQIHGFLLALEYSAEKPNIPETGVSVWTIRTLAFCFILRSRKKKSRSVMVTVPLLCILSCLVTVPMVSCLQACFVTCVLMLSYNAQTRHTQFYCPMLNMKKMGNFPHMVLKHNCCYSYSIR